jgi:peptidoglycan glycosyltransferase
MSRSIRRVAVALLVAFAALALMIGRWSMASDLIARDDNPRRIFVEQHIQRGAIVDRSNRILAETIPISGTLVRHYPQPAVAPAIGYTSINYGQAGVEEALDGVLRGSYGFVDQLLHRPRAGRDVRVTIDLALQTDLARRMTQPGAAIVLSIPDGAILAMASQPTFDPNVLDAQWKALSSDPTSPLLNRVTQGLYQPGAIFQTLVLADAIEHGQAALTETVSRPDDAVALDQVILDCARTGVMQTLADAYANACPKPFADLGATIGESELISITQQWHLDTPPLLEIRTTAAPTVTISLSTTVALNAYAAGQGQLTVSPLQMALVAATIGDNGFMPAPFLVQDVRSIDGQWVAYSGHGTRTPQHILSASTARSILAAMRTSDRIAGHGGAAFSGDKQLSWFIGLAPNDRPQYAIAVLIETPLGNAATEAEAMGRAVLKTLMQP